MESRISRIRKMERSYNRVRRAADALGRARARLDALSGEISRLEEYQASGLWREDFEADERGELPADLRRGVLSEDGLYNLLEEIDQFK